MLEKLRAMVEREIRLRERADEARAEWEAELRRTPLKQIRGDRKQRSVAARAGVAQSLVSDAERGEFYRVGSEALLRLLEEYEGG